MQIGIGFLEDDLLSDALVRWGFATVIRECSTANPNRRIRHCAS